MVEFSDFTTRMENEVLRGPANLERRKVAFISIVKDLVARCQRISAQRNTEEGLAVQGMERKLLGAQHSQDVGDALSNTCLLALYLCDMLAGATSCELKLTMGWRAANAPIDWERRRVVAQRANDAAIEVEELVSSGRQVSESVDLVAEKRNIPKGTIWRFRSKRNELRERYGDPCPGEDLDWLLEG